MTKAGDNVATFTKASYSSTRNISGNFLELNKLIDILPVDYLLHIKSGKEVVWEGIAWVFGFDGMTARFKDYAVLNFEINYNNTDAIITVAWQRC